MSPAARTRLSWILGVAFAAAMVMGTGPGVLLVNRPQLFLGLPVIYVWGIFWYGVQLTVIVLAYVFLWRAVEAAPAEGER